MKKVVLIALLACGAASVGFGSICENNCNKRNYICADDWYVLDTSAHEYCKINIEEQRQKCIQECRKRQE